jgi:hypothetical protein
MTLGNDESWISNSDVKISSVPYLVVSLDCMFSSAMATFR